MNFLPSAARAAAAALRDIGGNAAHKFRQNLDDTALDAAKGLAPVYAGLSQAMLAELGYYRGKADNLFATKSQEALGAYLAASDKVKNKLEDLSSMNAEILEAMADEIEEREQEDVAEDNDDELVDGGDI